MRYRSLPAIGLLLTALVAIGCNQTATTPQAPTPVVSPPAPTPPTLPPPVEPPAPRVITIDPDQHKPLVDEQAALYNATPFGKGAVYIQEDLGKPGSNNELRYDDPAVGHPQVVAKPVAPGRQVDLPVGDWPWLVWLDWSQETWQWSIFARNMESGVQVTVAATGETAPTIAYPPPMLSISGTQIVWDQVTEPEKADLYLYDLVRLERRRLTNSGDVGRAEIVDGQVVFERSAAADKESIGLWQLDLATGKQRQVVKGAVSDFGFGGRYLAYGETEPMERGSRSTLFLLDLQTGQRRQLAPSTGDGQSYYIAASKEWVAWQGPELSRLHAYSPAHPERPELVIDVPWVLSAQGYILHPALSGKSLVWLGLMGSMPLGTHREMVYQMWLD